MGWSILCVPVPVPGDGSCNSSSFRYPKPTGNRRIGREAWRQWTELSANKKRTCQRRGKVKKSKRVRVGEKNWRDGEGGNGGKDKLADKGRGLPRGASLWLLSGLGT